MAVLRTESSAANLVTTGGFEANTTGWSAEGSSTIARDTTVSKFGVASLSVITGNVAAGEGTFYSFAGAASTQYTGSMWVRGSGTARVYVWDNLSGQTYGAVVTLTSEWQTLSVTKTTAAGSSSWSIGVVTDVQQAITFYVDGVRVEAAPAATPNVEALVPARSRFARLAA